MSEYHREYLAKLIDKAESVVTTRLAQIETGLNLKAEMDRRRDAAVLSLKTITLKSVNEVLREYQDTLERYVVDTVNGNMTGGEMSRAFRALIRRVAPEAYTEGMREGGVRDPEAEMEDDDDEAIAIWERDQLLYTDGLVEAAKEAAALAGDERTAKRDVLLGRVEEWVGALQALGSKGYLSAKSNLPLTWQVGSTEHCDTCQKLDGGRHRASWYTKRGYIPREPGSNSLDCKGYHCQCSLVDDDGNTVVP